MARMVSLVGLGPAEMVTRIEIPFSNVRSTSNLKSIHAKASNYKYCSIGASPTVT